MTYLPSYSKKLYQPTCYQWWGLNLPLPLKDAAENGQGHSCLEAMAVRHSSVPPSFSFFFSFPISLYPLFQLAGFCSLDVMVKDLCSGMRRGNKSLNQWESTCQCRGHGLDSWSRKIPHATGQLSPWATTTEPVLLELGSHSERSRHNEKPAHRNEEEPLLTATRERAQQ